MQRAGVGFLKVPEVRDTCERCCELRRASEAAWRAYMQAPTAEAEEKGEAYKIAANAERSHWNTCWPGKPGWRGRPYPLFPVGGAAR